MALSLDSGWRQHLRDYEVLGSYGSKMDIIMFFLFCHYHSLQMARHSTCGKIEEAKVEYKKAVALNK